MMRRIGMRGRVIAILITFTISGLWHGASMVFLFWGIFNGIALSYEMITIKSRKKFWAKFSPVTGKFIAVTITFIFTVMSFTFGRANNLAEGFYIIKYSILGMKGSIYQLMHHSLKLNLGMTKTQFLIAFMAVILMELIQYVQRGRSVSEVIQKYPKIIRWSIYYLFVWMIISFGVFDQTNFIYFQF